MYLQTHNPFLTCYSKWCQDYKQQRISYFVVETTSNVERYYFLVQHCATLLLFSDFHECMCT